MCTASMSLCDVPGGAVGPAGNGGGDATQGRRRGAAAAAAAGPTAAAVPGCHAAGESLPDLERCMCLPAPAAQFHDKLRPCTPRQSLSINVCARVLVQRPQRVASTPYSGGGVGGTPVEQQQQGQQQLQQQPGSAPGLGQRRASAPRSPYGNGSSPAVTTPEQLQRYMVRLPLPTGCLPAF